VDDVRESLEQGRSPIILTERTEHLEVLQQSLNSLGAELIVLRGGMGVRQQREALKRIVDIPRLVIGLARM